MIKFDMDMEEFKEVIIPDLVEKSFPKGQCTERGAAIVLVAEIYIYLAERMIKDGI